MPSWWGKFYKNGKKKPKKESFIDIINRKFRISSEDKNKNQRKGAQRCCNGSISERGFQSHVPTRSPSSSTFVSRCQSFSERPVPQPLPIPSVNLLTVGKIDNGTASSPKPEYDWDSKDDADAEAHLVTASLSSDSSSDSDDTPDSHHVSPLTSDYENGGKTAVSSPSSLKKKDRSPISCSKPFAGNLKPADVSCYSQNRQIPPAISKRRPHMQKLQIPHRGVPGSAPESSMSSPARSPLRSFGLEPGQWNSKTCAQITLLGSGQSSSPGSGYTSGQNSIGGDFCGQLAWPQSRCSRECSPLPSPKMTSGPSSRIQSGAVTPLDPRAGGPVGESTMSRIDDCRQRSHRLPLPPLTITNTCPFSPNYSTVTSPSVPRSPARVETPTSPGSRWKKGRLLGRGTYGHVYLGFDRESGEMCAMKEVTLFPDDLKSKESAQQLGQEIMLLSRLRHPNIVRYYGSETIGDKLYIYLEYVSGGSIYKLLQEYGQFGESAIRNYTQQILSGMAYLHAKNTVHRDIKGANILVDPNGRVKLADFGMAKHITGQYCPFSFKGSPYWMSPEVIKNSNGCNHAVDIWSLGCTVFEMATTKPPWSQFEGVAAMFKIGNSKELPEIPDHLSEEGKDFLRLCLQRDPSLRPSAAQLLEHPFVKSASPLERPLSELPGVAPTAMRVQDIGNIRDLPAFDAEDVANPYPVFPAGSSVLQPRSPRNMSCPISPVGSPITRSRSPQPMSGRASPSLLSSPRTASNSCAPLTGGKAGGPFNPKQQQATGVIASRSQNSFYGRNFIQEHCNPDHLKGTSTPIHVFEEIIPSGQDEKYSDNVQTVLADHVSQQLLSEHLKLSRSLDMKPDASKSSGHTHGI